MATAKMSLAVTARIAILRPKAHLIKDVRKQTLRAASTTRKTSTQQTAPAYDGHTAAGRNAPGLWPPHAHPVDSSAQGRSETVLQRMPTSALVRNVILGALFTSPRLIKMALPVMSWVSNSKLLLSYPRRNPLVKLLIKPLVYDQFCAGVDASGVAKSRDSIKQMGFAGVILCCGQEVQVSKDLKLNSTASTKAVEDEITQWKNGYMETLEMIGDGDWIGIKMTGAGTLVTQALINNQAIPEEFHSAMDQICRRAKEKNARIWIDAEQQVLQTAIDRWTIDLMREHNRSGRAVVYNTIQAYLKASRPKLKEQLALADREGWTYAFKLVRGAYIGNDQREKIHDTKADTDASYNGIVRDVLQGTNLGFPEAEFPKIQLFLAGHNPESVDMAAKLVASLAKQNRLKVLPDFGQLQGMADLLGCQLLEHCEGIAKSEGVASVPKVYKCLTWGTVGECIQYLLRRMIENTTASERMRDGLSAYAAELRRRMSRSMVPSFSRR